MSYFINRLDESLKYIEETQCCQRANTLGAKGLAGALVTASLCNRSAWPLDAGTGRAAHD